MEYIQTFPLTDFKPDYTVMCRACRNTARIADELYQITTEGLLLDNVTRWHTLGIHIDTIANEFVYNHHQEMRQGIEVHRRIGIHTSNQVNSAQFEFCFRYDSQPHNTCPFGLMATILMNVEDNPNIAPGYIEDNITDLVLGQAGPDRLIPGITVITRDERIEEARTYYTIDLYATLEGLREPQRGFERIDEMRVDGKTGGTWQYGRKGGRINKPLFKKINN